MLFDGDLLFDKLPNTPFDCMVLNYINVVPTIATCVLSYYDLAIGFAKGRVGLKIYAYYKVVRLFGAEGYLAVFLIY